jgi:hypothetical protein
MSPRSIAWIASPSEPIARSMSMATLFAGDAAESSRAR